MGTSRTTPVVPPRLPRLQLKVSVPSTKHRGAGRGPRHAQSSNRDGPPSFLVGLANAVVTTPQGATKHVHRQEPTNRARTPSVSE